jgi:malate dehydrogenase (oxaloacetate-decarboxylating)(NADP+)
VARAYGGEPASADSSSPPFDPRLILRIAPAVAKAAMETGVAKRRSPISRPMRSSSRFVFRSGFVMKPCSTKARPNPKRVIYAEGEDERVLRAARSVLEEGIGQPILIGRPQR